MTHQNTPLLPLPDSMMPFVVALQRRGRIILRRVLPRLGKTLMMRMKKQFAPPVPVAPDPKRPIRVDRRV
ncbi:hypothetical protein P775_20295 [Puniceibacterium antarcticum]|uniref:Uncharacterized protein n=1 Tax=Puniceibacterium antarcticum TaxID=1206336 RepID=A0A2G8R9Q3_9RHOB|nr:hypothetical protein [Puniceibacterium antarcticum]PIL18295.1 hypothetical protein P775_20295 [Puniceibacterium antarcticum]